MILLVLEKGIIIRLLEIYFRALFSNRDLDSKQIMRRRRKRIIRKIRNKIVVVIIIMDGL